MKKRIISLLLCAVMLIGLLPTSALAITINTNDNYQSSGSWEDKSTGYQYSYNVYTDITDQSLYAELTGVTINSEATGIELTIPGTVPYTPVGESEQQIPLRVISGVNSNAIKSVSIPASVEIIGADVFKNNSNLETVTFGESSKLRIIGDSAFCDCHALKNCDLPQTVETIGSKAFYFTGLTSVTFGVALTALGTEAFAHCYSLANLDMIGATQLKVIPESCFSYSSLTTLIIPDSVETIGDWAFAGLGGPNDSPSPLTSLNLGNGVKTIGEYAFNGNTNLTGKLILPDSVSSIGKGAFAACGYTDVKWPEGNGDFTVVNGFSQCRSLTGAAIESLPLSVATIGEEAFWDCINLGSVTIPASVRTIEEKAFYNAGITSLTIANGVQTIEKNSFQGCADLLGTEIAIPVSVTTLASGAFSELFTLNEYAEVDVSKSLTVKVMNPNLVLAEEPGDYQYFAADDTGHKNPSYTGDAFAGCVNLILYAPAGAPTAKAYADKFNGVIIQATKENINFWYSPRTVEFRELTDVPVYHTVTLPDEGSDVTFTVKQDGKTLTPDSEGSFQRSMVRKWWSPPTRRGITIRSW